LFGLIGNPIKHSYSKEYFDRKFQVTNRRYLRYLLFPLQEVDELPGLINRYPNLEGLNVTLPFKKQVLRYIDHLSPEAKGIGAVNCIRIEKAKVKPVLFGYNTDVFGFESSLKTFLKPIHKKALILGTGGSSAAVAFVLKSYNVDFCYVSRLPHQDDQISYNNLNLTIMKEHLLIINTTPAGMFPETDDFPPIPYNYLTPNHILFDLIYNPPETLFLKKGREKGALTINGMQMLYLQAEKSCEIWQI
jgi:shikimate dehydrogenase